ncbi:MAG TPA: hypothetical protein PLU87_18000, partial [Sedimentisphaerales bacterium]|nr:hypothetical protein [Sedimentisphaerales bacterium]HRV49518.1 hypothetical protein [Sedimentisphaerales bacterium]
SLKTLHPDGRIEEEIWRASERKPGMSRLVTVTIPLAAGNGDPPRRFEIAIWANGSVEAASRRATLFGRLIDEHSPTGARGGAGGSLAAASEACRGQKAADGGFSRMERAVLSGQTQAIRGDDSDPGPCQ